jgi:hypothetical protein
LLSQAWWIMIGWSDFYQPWTWRRDTSFCSLSAGAGYIYVRSHFMLSPQAPLLVEEMIRWL